MGKREAYRTELLDFEEECVSISYMERFWGGLVGPVLPLASYVQLDRREGVLAAWGEVVGLHRLIIALMCFFHPQQGESEPTERVLLEPTFARVDWLNAFPELRDDRWRRCSLLICGGPVNNEVTREVFGWGNPQAKDVVPAECRFVQLGEREWGLAVPGYGDPLVEKWSELRSSAGSGSKAVPYLEEDYGLVLRKPNPWNPDSRGAKIMLFAGVKCGGSAAAVAACVLPGLLDHLAAAYGEGPFEAVVRLRNELGDFGPRQKIKIIWPPEAESDEIPNPSANERFNRVVHFLADRLDRYPDYGMPPAPAIACRLSEGERRRVTGGG